jgi:DNA polymerase (family 10)
MTNARIAATFERVAELLELQGASPHRVRAWRDGAQGIREHDREMADVFRDHGRVGLEAVPHIGPRLSAEIIELLRTGRCGALDRLQGEVRQQLGRVPEPGEVARRPATPELERRPPVGLLLEIDRAYREGAAAGTLPKIAPRRFNPTGEAWLPVLHVDRDAWAFTALYSNTARAHQLGRTDDWVILYFHELHLPEGQATVVTERRGKLRGRRVVRGRELECESFYDQQQHAA